MGNLLFRRLQTEGNKNGKKTNTNQDAKKNKTNKTNIPNNDKVESEDDSKRTLYTGWITKKTEKEEKKKQQENALVIECNALEITTNDIHANR